MNPGRTRRVPGGTAFFVLVREQDTYVAYAVTARHCVEAVAGRSLYVRVNTETGYHDIETRAEAWYTHDRADVAVISLDVKRPNGEGYALAALTLEEFIDAEHRYRTPDAGQATFVAGDDGSYAMTDAIPVEAGNEVFFVGLFIQHSGERQILPVARFGQIARMPIEPIALDRRDGTSFRAMAYLVECRSWGGFSGSPVYWRHPVAEFVALDAPPDAPPHLVTDGKVLVQNPEGEVTAFLGLISGHFDIEQPAKISGDVPGTITTRINSGIAVVTPAEAVRELLMRDDVVEDRERDLRGA